MKLCYILIFIVPILTNEVVFDLMNLDLIECNISDSSPEDTSEGEKSDKLEDKNKVNNFSEFFNCNMHYNTFAKQDINLKLNNIPQPLIEVFSPPPER